MPALTWIALLKIARVSNSADQTLVKGLVNSAALPLISMSCYFLAGNVPAERFAWLTGWSICHQNSKFRATNTDRPIAGTAGSLVGL
jgi:hypothetical protein